MLERSSRVEQVGHMYSPVSYFTSVAVNVSDLRFHTGGIVEPGVKYTDAGIILIDWALHVTWRLNVVEVGCSNGVMCNRDSI